MSSSRLRVAVIGAGAAGLCSARHILSRPLRFYPPVVFEATDRVGGTWVYDEDVDSRHVHSSMYRDLRTNLPKEIMEFPDFSFDPALPSFIHHSEVLKYLEEYTNHFSIRPHVKFNTQVVSVSPVPEEGEKIQVSWDVTFQSQGDGDPVTERFDNVMVCVGHYSDPLVPDIKGLENFQGQVLHSHYYRFPEAFSSRSVVVFGSGPSGVDIAIELCPHANHVTMSHRGRPLQWTPPKNFSDAPPVVEASVNSLICEDGTEILADTLIFCTGYKYNYPFLLTDDDVMAKPKKDKSVGLSRTNVEKHGHLESRNYLEGKEELQPNDCFKVKVNLFKNDLLETEEIVGPDLERGHLPPLYKHLIHARYPTLCFIGVCKIVIPFPLFHCQVQFFLSVLEGQCLLPPPEQMLSESRQEVQSAKNSGIPLKYLHRLGTMQWEYNQWLADTTGFEPLPPVLSNLYKYIHRFQLSYPTLYRQLNIKILSREEFEVEGELAQEDQRF